jgi:hypothetical protein
MESYLTFQEAQHDTEATPFQTFVNFNSFCFVIEIFSRL